jgi:hypothetical protein
VQAVVVSDSGGPDVLEKNHAGPFSLARVHPASQEPLVIQRDQRGSC